MLAWALPLAADPIKDRGASGPADQTVAATLAGSATPATTNAAAAATETDAPVSPEMMKEGEALFLRNCRQCHGSKGTAGVPLKGNENIADAGYVASVILVGPGYMTGFAETLKDEQIAAIASYVRNSWGNSYGAVTPQDVAEMR